LAANRDQPFPGLLGSPLPKGYTLAPEQLSACHLQLPVLRVPPGAKRDKMWSPGFYEGVSQYLTDLGVPQV